MDGYQLLKAKAGDFKDKTLEILIQIQDTIFSFLLSVLVLAFLTALSQHRSPLSPSSSSGKGGTNFQLKHNAVSDILGSNSQSFLFFSYSSGSLKICSGAIKACQLDADATSI